MSIEPRKSSESSDPQDKLNAIGVLQRREIEARIIGPLIRSLAEAFDPDEVIRVVRQTIIQIARQQGEQLAVSMGGCTLAHFAASLDAWTRDGALEMDIYEQSPAHFSFRVTRCRYAEMYRELGMPELGALLSCSRDYALIEGFNRQVTLTRPQTIMDGAPVCDFRYELESPPQG